MEYGCIGEHLPHSFSKEIHERIEDYDYVLQEIEKGNLDAFMQKHDFKAINVTIPYKQDVIPHLYYVADIAKSIGAVNTIVNRDGKLYGYNTDFGGMNALLSRMGLSLKDKKVLILGTGGTSKTANALSHHLGAREVYRVSRTRREDALSYEDIYEHHTDAEVILNTTPSGMFPNVEGCPIDLTKFPKLEGVMDAVYNPLRTNFVLKAMELGLKAEGGLYMLVAQAVLAAEIFTGKKYASDLMDKVFDSIYDMKENVVLVGMSASGKSTIGKLYAERSGRKFVDSDALIVEKAGMPIPDIFAKYGEKHFRDLEQEVIEELSKQGGLVIATGGGAVLREANVHALRRNGKLYLLDRPLRDLLPTDDRPLANTVEKITALYHEREPIYKAAADAVITVTGDPLDAAMQIEESRKSK